MKIKEVWQLNAMLDPDWILDVGVGVEDSRLLQKALLRKLAKL